ncbi:hypothetical protein NQ317_013210 [Molorchus minor]|uniref:Trehalase n=1 Tax=Molorchus minor TaxID=1323400 RepID=A0ABQ9J5N5_9CUCU|nr:hypothetical protein NQ317_013210 [Molorchus minor]
MHPVTSSTIMQLITVILTVIIGCTRVELQTLQSCDSLVYCQGSLLDTVQKSGIFDDSKTFVDLTQSNPPATTLSNFEKLMKDTNNNPSVEQIRDFLDKNFISETELEQWAPSDYQTNPDFLWKIDDVAVRDFARQLIGIWPTLARKIKKDVAENPDKHSLIPVPNGFIIPGGRFRELYYWDSYWIVKGLLLSQMDKTAKGMIENLITFVDRYGYIPNGGRVYYLNRSQPPLLTLMVGLYVDAMDDKKWLRKVIGYLEKEMQWWLNNRTVTVEKNGVKHTMVHFASASGTPRPESYIEDIKTCSGYGDQKKKENCYKEIKSGAESGWDFSSRWIIDSNGGTNANLTNIQTRRIIPVDLNAFLCKAFSELSRFYTMLGEPQKAIKWLEKSKTWQKSIELVLYDKADGIWYDFDATTSKPRRIFYPSNFAPLWTESYQPLLAKGYGAKAAKYFRGRGVNDYRGGIPTSLIRSGEQWDYPNAWPPLQEIVILGLKKTGEGDAKQVAETFAKRWIDANIRGYNQNNEMFEKYDAINSGQYGGGGEYTVQTGFGWTNGVALSLIEEYYVKTDSNDVSQPTNFGYPATGEPCLFAVRSFQTSRFK